MDDIDDEDEYEDYDSDDEFEDDSRVPFFMYVAPITIFCSTLRSSI